MDPILRAGIEALPSYVPGRTIPGAIKLASNEVSLPPPERVLAAIAEAAAAGNRYPDNGVIGLTAKIAERRGVSPEQVAVSCGSVSLLPQLLQITCTGAEDEVLFAWRSFEMYPIVSKVIGATPVTVPLDADARHDLAALARAVTPRTRVLFLCSPNNPTGPAIRRDELLTLLDAIPPRVLVVLDEAYREFVTDPDAPDGIDLLPGRPNLVVLRTFSKAYRLAGIRVGYAVGAPQVISALRKVYVTFSVSSLAQAAAGAALDCLDELEPSWAEITKERSRVLGALGEAGFAVPESQANFVWLPLGDDAVPFSEHCERHKVVVRPFAGSGVRVSVAGAEENDAFLAVARAWSG
ncbi:histidinol-phosphate transaminase [Pseudonocardia eucalypti]|uniref:Aromatic amino acid aminotransferase n=1 Tax=Pseudonocardia eucalypti TaxID=648755 RepID=A0ABP9PE13_9PSEU|nr:histidinol-phosphate aminotransferase [Pseudonocardia eucalypti]